MVNLDKNLSFLPSGQPEWSKILSFGLLFGLFPLGQALTDLNNEFKILDIIHRGRPRVHGGPFGGRLEDNLKSNVTIQKSSF